MKIALRLALLGAALPLLIVAPAHADPYKNDCTVPPNSVVTGFTATCTASGGGTNVDSGTYTFSFTWLANPCLAGSGAVAGTVSGSGPWGPFAQGAALAVLNSSVHDLNFGFYKPTGAATGRHTAFFRFTCVGTAGILQATGTISQIEAVSAAGSLPDSAYCPYGGMSGAIQYQAPGAGWTGTTPFTMALNITCNGAGVTNGSYQITSTGIEYGGCNNGTGAGTISGTGPGGQSITGAWTYGRNTVHYYGFPPNGTGYIRMGGVVYGFYLWLDVAPIGQTSGGPLPCPLPGGPLVGHGLVIA